MAVPKFGEEMKSQFQLDPKGIHLNHGSWGAPPKVVLAAKRHALEEFEVGPDRYWIFNYFTGWTQQLEIVCDFLGWKKENTVLVENATAGLNSAIKCMPLQTGEAILLNNWIYGSIRNCCLDHASRTGADVITLQLSLPINDKQEVIDAYTRSLEDNPNIRLAVIDHISSGPTLKFPIKELVEVCHAHNVICIIDGAHAPGMLELDMEDMGADIYVGNLHKWCYGLRGSAVLWASDTYRDVIEPSMIGHGYQGTMQQKFQHQGARDPSSYHCLKDSINFYKSIGGVAAVTRYTSSLLDKAEEYLTALWKTEKFPIPADMEVPSIKTIGFPSCANYKIKDQPKAADADGDFNFNPGAMHTQILLKYNITTNVFEEGGKCYVRLSANIYNTLDDYKSLGKAVLDYLEMK